MFSEIRKNKRTCVFVSPHLDDAILSCGELLGYLSKHTKVIVVNVFTDGGKLPYSLSVRKFLRQCGYRSSGELFEDRIAEDLEVFRKLHIKPVELRFTDGLFRKTNDRGLIFKFFSRFIPEFSYVYPTYKHILRGRVSSRDGRLVKDLSRELGKIVRSGDLVFCPVGVGEHVDHIVVRDVCANGFRNVIFWQDFPYSLKNKVNEGFVKARKLKKVSFRGNWSRKDKLIKGYKSQFGGLFPSGEVPKVKEIYFSNG